MVGTGAGLEGTGRTDKSGPVSLNTREWLMRNRLSMKRERHDLHFRNAIQPAKTSGAPTTATRG
jgi:hypothetical protein